MATQSPGAGLSRGLARPSKHGASARDPDGQWPDPDAQWPAEDVPTSRDTGSWGTGRQFVCKPPFLPRAPVYARPRSLPLPRVWGARPHAIAHSGGGGGTGIWTRTAHARRSCDSGEDAGWPVALNRGAQTGSACLTALAHTARSCVTPLPTSQPDSTLNPLPRSPAARKVGWPHHAPLRPAGRAGPVAAAPAPGPLPAYVTPGGRGDPWCKWLSRYCRNAGHCYFPQKHPR